MPEYFFGNKSFKRFVTIITCIDIIIGLILIYLLNILFAKTNNLKKVPIENRYFFLIEYSDVIMEILTPVLVLMTPFVLLFLNSKRFFNSYKTFRVVICFLILIFCMIYSLKLYKLINYNLKEIQEFEYSFWNFYSIFFVRNRSENIEIIWILKQIVFFGSLFFLLAFVLFFNSVLLFITKIKETPEDIHLELEKSSGTGSKSISSKFSEIQSVNNV